ncbi:hypothetical protein BDV23DRAFT_86640 [Aspergillus alliaceus]|uniref:Uncharacterized protein n=2 Tax=Petromyces alliaceus TaxID=209559 RepID=A0A5N7C9F2_PETAA|nr:hypothetical protein BDV23DRAFT_86640 [Aspergillus alliaceus]
MTPEQVTHFVNGYYPSYELFTETLRAGTFRPIRYTTTASRPSSGWEGRQLHLVVDKHRKVQEVSTI